MRRVHRVHTRPQPLPLYDAELLKEPKTGEQAEGSRGQGRGADKPLSRAWVLKAPGPSPWGAWDPLHQRPHACQTPLQRKHGFTQLPQSTRAQAM